ncbi:hypothetical protein [Tropicimonas sp.]|uniref:hypothetical protein n=1 Tax=Tropicimonas sp. TaxID=2067044 RepID=UPI003A8B322C
MTALTKYSRLEAPGIWRADPQAQRRDVIVSFGDTSLVISDRNDRALSHWSLAAVVRINKGTRPALYTPSADGAETLEIEDGTMINAIETVRSAVLRGRPHPGRLRTGVVALVLAAVVAIALFWLPDALVRHTVSVVPEPTRAEIGAELLRAIGRVSGAPCRSARGDQALGRLHTRLIGPGKGSILVLREGVAESMSLPGGTILINRALVEDHESPDVVAGHILAEAQRRAADDPVQTLLESAGPVPTFRLLTTGHLPDGAIRAYAEQLISAQPAPVDRRALLKRFAAAGVSSSPYAYALDVTGETTLDLIESDPMRGHVTKPLLTDADWVALQEICGT